MANSSASPKSNIYRPDPRLIILNDMIASNPEELLLNLNVDLKNGGDMYYGPCPIHGGDRHNAFNLYPEGYSVKGYWQCRTKNCHGVSAFGNNYIGFARGVLSHQRCGWSYDKPTRNLVSFSDTIQFLCKVVGIDSLKDIKVDLAEIERIKFLSECRGEAVFAGEVHSGGRSREEVRRHLEIPAEYYIDRGYSPEILNKYDVGIAKTPRATIDRVVVPVYDPNHRQVGYTARSIHEKCSRCSLYHSPTQLCPETDSERDGCTKWRHSKFKANSTLYNFWYSKKHIEESKTAVFVEGPGDIWRLEEAGICNGVALFGTSLSEKQHELLLPIGILKAILLFDKDEAGANAVKKFREEYRRYFQIFVPQINKKDVGEMTQEEIREMFNGL